MRKLIVFLFVFLISIAQIEAQVTIGSATPPDATLDVVANGDSNTPVGLMAPRVKLSLLNENAAKYGGAQKGTIVFVTEVDEPGENTTEDIKTPGYYYFNGNRWVQFVIPEVVTIPTEPWRDAGTGAEATSNTQDIYQNARVIIGSAGSGEPTAQLDVSSGSRGILIPRLDAAQRNSIGFPAESLLIWNTDEECFNFWRKGKWRSLCGDLGEAEISVTNADCDGMKIEGNYKVGSSTTSGEYLEVTLQVTEPGSYIIEGNPRTGFFFQRSGTFTQSGTYTIQIPAIGTPNQPGPNQFYLTINGSNAIPECLKEVEVEPADVKFSFDQSYCGQTAEDKLVRGEASTGKTIKIKVNVVNGGIFNFYTNTVSGVQYTASNVNLTAGSHEVTLISNGARPTTAGIGVSFPVSGTGLDGQTCDVLVDIEENTADITPDWSTVKVYGKYNLDVESTSGDNYIEVLVTPTSTGNWAGTATNSEAGFTFTGSGTFTENDVNRPKMIRLYASGIPVVAGAVEFTLDINGATHPVMVNVLLPVKNVLVIGAADAMYNSIRNTSNFGPDGKTQIESINITRQGLNPNVSTLVNLINSNKIDVIVAGASFQPNDEAAGVIADFIKNKKGSFIYVGLQDRQTYLNRVIQKTFGVGFGTTEDEIGIYLAKFPDNIDNPYVNGVFGDLRGKWFRADDASSWGGITPENEASTNGVLKSLISLPSESSSRPARNVFNYADGFFLMPDHGSQYNGGAYYGGYSPITTSTTASGNISSYNGESYGNTNVPAGDVVSWLLFGNAVDHALRYAHKNLVKDYQVATGRY